MKKFYNLFDKLCHKCVCEYHILFKLINICTLFGTAIFFTALGINPSDYKIYQFSEIDLWIWIGVLYALALLQVVTLTSETKSFSFDWANTVLMTSGFALVIIGLVFGAAYPPFQWQSTVYPLLGTVFCGFAYICNRADKNGIN